MPQQTPTCPGSHTEAELPEVETCSLPRQALAESGEICDGNVGGLQADRRALRHFLAQARALQLEIASISRISGGKAGMALRRVIFFSFLEGSGLERAAVESPGWFPENPDALEMPADVMELCRPFLENYDWQLGMRTPITGSRVGPDVLGALLEQSLRRKETGAYYTAPDVTAYICRNAIYPRLLRLWKQQGLLPACADFESSVRDAVTRNQPLEGTVHRIISETPHPEALAESLISLTILDPTCGSGDFLLAAMDCLLFVRDTLLSRMKSPESHDHGEQPFTGFVDFPLRQLHGVDLMPEAVEVCRMRLLLRLLASGGQQQFTQTGGLPKTECPNPGLAIWARFGKALPAAETLPLVAAFEQIQVGNILVLQECFPEAMARGGFDIVIGNPPYLEAAEVDYDAPHLETAATGAVHAMCIERGLQFLRPEGCMGMIVPMSLVSTQRMAPVQRLLEREGRDVWYANFSWRPARLFEDVNRALTIFLVCPSPNENNGGEKPGRTFSTGYTKWVSADRPHLFSSLRYTETIRERPFPWVPKFQHPIEQDILEKFLRIPTRLEHWMATGNQLSTTDITRTQAGNMRFPAGNERMAADIEIPGGVGNRIYYRTTGGLYWKVFTDFPPAFRLNGHPARSSREIFFCVNDPALVPPIIAVLSSDCFWWWYTVSSNCRDLNPFDLRQFPVPGSALSDSRLKGLGLDYLADLHRNSQLKVRNQASTGRTETQCFAVRESRPIIEAINHVLMTHYKLTEGEYGFLSAYDLSFRMGDGVGTNVE